MFFQRYYFYISVVQVVLVHGIVTGKPEQQPNGKDIANILCKNTADIRDIPDIPKCYINIHYSCL